MTDQRKLLLQTLAGHFAWLKAAHPRKAANPIARRAERAVLSSLRGSTSSPRLRKAA